MNAAITPTVMNYLATICLSAERYTDYRATSALCLADWEYCLEVASYAGFDVTPYVDRINQQNEVKISITSLTDKMTCLQMIDDQNGTNMVGALKIKIRAAKRRAVLSR